MNDLYDVVVIGAGIHGAGVAQAAAAQGYSVLVLEQFSGAAQGTSSRSSKLIHGGLRYLETGEFHLVRECLRERQLLIQNASDLVHWQKFYIPVYKNSKHKTWKIFLGLCLYAVLAGLGKHSRFRRVPRREWSLLDGLNQQDLKTVFQYWDGQTDDASLTKAVLKSALSMNARIIYNATFLKAESQRQTYEIQYSIDGAIHECTTHALVNAGGPWVSKVSEKIKSAQKKPNIDLVQGTHITLPNLSLRGIYYVEAPSDGRVMFVMPWQGFTLVGTTENIYKGEPADVKPLASEIHYLLETFNHYFPGRYHQKNISSDDIINSFAGLRVLPRAEGSFATRSRETLLLTDSHKAPRLVSIYGGKLTSYRSTAEKVLNILKRQLPWREKRTDTTDTSLYAESK